MRFVLKSVLLCAFCLLAFSSASAQKSSKPESFHTEGVFSNIKASEFLRSRFAQLVSRFYRG